MKKIIVNLRQRADAQRMKNFLIYLRKMELVEIIGVAKILGVKVYDANGKPRKGEKILLKTVEAFKITPLKRQKELLSLMRAATKKPNPIAVMALTIRDKIVLFFQDTYRRIKRWLNGTKNN